MIVETRDPMIPGSFCEETLGVIRQFFFRQKGEVVRELELEAHVKGEEFSRFLGYTLNFYRVVVRCVVP